MVRLHPSEKCMKRNLTMNASLLALLISLVTVTAMAQGTVNFVNITTGLNSPIYSSDGTTKLSGSAWTAELLLGPALNKMTSVATAGFLTGAGAGYFQGGVVSAQNVPPGGTAWCVVLVWATAFGSFSNALAANQFNVCSTSAPFQVVLGGVGVPPTLPAPLLGLTSFNLNLAIGEHPGLAKLNSHLWSTNTLSFAWDGGDFGLPSWWYALQQNPDLKPTHWVSVTNAADYYGGTGTMQVTVPAPTRNMYYRLLRVF